MRKLLIAAAALGLLSAPALAKEAAKSGAQGNDQNVNSCGPGSTNPECKGQQDQGNAGAEENTTGAGGPESKSGKGNK